MLNKILQINSEKGIINNLTLSFTNKSIANEYNMARYNFTKYLIVTLINFLMSVAVTIISAISYFNPPTIFVSVHIFLAFLTLGTIVLGLIFLLLAMHTNKFKIVLAFVLSSMHLINFTIMAHLLRLLIANNNRNVDISKFHYLFDFTWIIEGYCQVFYLFFIQNSFRVHFCSYFSTTLFLIIVELFLAQSKEYAIFSMYSFVSATCAVIFCYMHERRDKQNFYYMYKYSLKAEYSECFVNSEKCFSCSFKDNSIFHVNDPLKDQLKTIAGHKELELNLDQLFTNNLFNKKLNTESKYKNEIEEISTLTKKICLTGFKNFNEKLPLLLKEYLSPLKGSLPTNILVERCKYLFSYLRDNKDQFDKFSPIGIKEDQITGKSYYSFFRVNSNQTIEFIFIEIDAFPEKEIGNSSFEQIAMFSSKVTHEIKNPLIAIKTLIHKIIEIISSLVPKDVMNSLDKILDYANYMMIITKDFEYFAKLMSAGENEQKYLVSDLNYQAVNFRDVVDFSISLIQSAKMKEMSVVEIDKDIDEAICNTIVTDELRLKQVLINLLSNSLKFTKMGKITIICEDENEDFIKIIVADTGIGIKEDDLKKLLDPTSKFVKSNTSANKFGAGLGLCIVKDIVSKIGKNLEIKSKYNYGTSISFLLKKNNSGEKNPVLEKTNIGSSEVIDGNLNLNLNNTTTKLLQIGAIENSDQTQDNLIKEQITKREDFQPKKINLSETINNLQKKFSYALSRDIISQASTVFEMSRIKSHNRKHYVSKYTHVDSQSRSHQMSLDVSPMKKGITVISNDSDNNHQAGMSPNNNDIEGSLKSKKKINVIVVDDDNIIRNSTCNVIKKFCKENEIDVNIEECSDGIDCLYRIYKGFKEGEKYSIIITDESMDFLGGSFMSYIIKTLILNRAFYPINIYLSSCYSAKPPLKYKGIQIFEDVLQKPLERHNLENIFNNEVNIN